MSQFTRSDSARAGPVRSTSLRSPFPRKGKGKPCIPRSRDQTSDSPADLGGEPGPSDSLLLPLSPPSQLPSLGTERLQENPAPCRTHLDILPVPLLLPAGRLALVVGGVGAQGAPHGEPGDRAGVLQSCRHPTRVVVGASSSCQPCVGARVGIGLLGPTGDSPAPCPSTEHLPVPTNRPTHPEEHSEHSTRAYLASAFPGGSMRVCHLEESVSRLGRMWPSRVSVSCCMSRQKMAYSSSTARSVCSFRVSFSSSCEARGRAEGGRGTAGPFPALLLRSELPPEHRQDPAVLGWTPNRSAGGHGHLPPAPHTLTRLLQNQ